ncbi:hypothetical protein F511_42673 [Dorcoceras hygrometricum]|uniref:Uncharacterized protein n=1 Tax=Dorcoceras hygrometricum TaxID=472368 RepID=A0A2Z7AAA9_9LAMI|nr:hypothetical protein F511_42673 [Dorcoceras hygrometricum]
MQYSKSGMHVAVKEHRSSRPANQLAVISIEPLYPHSVSTGGNHRSVIIRPVSHHSSVVFRHNQSVGHHSDDSVGLFRHNSSVGRSQRGSQIRSSIILSIRLKMYAYVATVGILQQKPAFSSQRNHQQPSDVAFTKEHKNDAAALQQLTTDSFLNNQQLVTLNNSNEDVKNTSPSLPTADQKRCTKNAAFQLNKTKSPHHQQLVTQTNSWSPD